MNTPYGIEAHPHTQPQATPRQYGHTAIVALFLLVLALVVGGSNVQAQTVAPSSLFLDPAQAAAGAVVLVNGQGFSPGGDMLTIFWDGQKMATHPMDVGDAFSIPFPVPDKANPGDHRLEVCLGDPCAADQKIRASALFQVSTVLPRFTSTIGYVFDTDKTQAAEFSDLLSKVGINLVTIPLTDVTQTDWSAYPLVIVGSDTGDGSRWGTVEQVAALQKAARIVGVGAGGYAFFGQLDLTIGYPNGTAAQAQSITAGDPQLTSLRVPYDLTTLMRNQREMALFDTPVDAVAVDLANQPTDILAHAYLGPASKPSTLGVIAGQGCRTLWGFLGAPSEMTPLGQTLFVNLVVFALGNNCDVSLTAPCGPLFNQATIPGAAVIDFDDMQNGVEIADFYANSYGVRFEQSSTNHAIIYGGHPNDPSQPRSAPNVAANSAIYPTTSEGAPLSIFFDQDQSHVGMWIGNGEDGQGNPAGLTAVLTGFDRQGKELCRAQVTPVPVSHTSFIGLNDAYGRIARLELDYGRTLNSEAIDDLIFGPFAPANNIRVCHKQTTTCAPAAGARVIVLHNGTPAGQPLKTDSQGFVWPRRRIRYGDSLWVTLPISTTTRSTFFHTSGSPRSVLPAAFNHFGNQEMIVTVSPSNPLLLYNLTVSTQWSLIGDSTYQNRLRSDIQKAANYLYDFTDGQISLGRVQVYQNYDMWDEADVRIYASNNLRPHAAIGGVNENPVQDPLVDNVSYYPGYTFMGRTWNRFNLPGEPSDLGVDVSNDWPLALAHEFGHYFLYLFDTYLAVTPDGELVETKSCTGSAMGWVYDADNTEFIFDSDHWTNACGETLANHTLNRNEWQTILLWYSSLLAPTTVNPGPSSLPASFADVTIHPPSNPALVLPNQTFTLTYQAGETASAEARAFLVRDNRVIDQGKPHEGATRITLVGAQTDDRFCVFDVNDFTDDSASPRHQYGCEVLTLDDNTLQMEKDDAWAPVIGLSPVTSRTVLITVTQEISAGLSLHAVLYPEDTNMPTEIVLARDGDLHTGTFTSPVDATAAYVQVFVDEAASETDPRRETMVDYGVGGNGAEGPATWYGGAPVTSSDGKAEFARRTDVFLKKGEFIALQSMAGTPRPPVGRRIVGQAYRLVALPHSLADEGHVALRVRPPRSTARIQKVLPKVTVAFWDGKVWTPVKSVNLDDLVDGRIAIAPSQGVGVYVLLLDEGTPVTNPVYLPRIER